MPDEVLIEKASGTEPWSADRAAGTMMVAGIDKDVALRTVDLAKGLFAEFGVTRISSTHWVLLSEELRRNNLAAAAVFVSTLPNRRGFGLELAAGDDGDDPRDIPRPRFFGEEIDPDYDYPPVYIISDFHVGSSRVYGAVNKRKSNDMDQKTLDWFLRWLNAVDADARKYDHYDVVMNGDFLDMWQAELPVNDSNERRLKDIIASNSGFIEKLGKHIRSKSPRCRFYYVIGNHDDALYGSDDNSHRRLRNQFTTALRTEIELVQTSMGQVRRPRINNDLMSFAMNRRYTNPHYGLLVEHGHQYDSFNWKDDDDAESIGQSIAEFVNHMQQSSDAFKSIEYTPNQETVKHLACLKQHPNTSQEVLDLIDGMESVAMSAALSDSFFGAIADGLEYLVRGDRSVLDHPAVSPKKVRKTNEEAAKDIIDDDRRIPRVKIVSFGHTHLRDLQPRGRSTWAYANTGTWMDEIVSGRTAAGCVLTRRPSPLPYVKICRVKGADEALVELNCFRGRVANRSVLVKL